MDLDMIQITECEVCHLHQFGIIDLLSIFIYYLKGGKPHTHLFLSHGKAKGTFLVLVKLSHASFYTFAFKVALRRPDTNTYANLCKGLENNIACKKYLKIFHSYLYLQHIKISGTKWPG